MVANRKLNMNKSMYSNIFKEYNITTDVNKKSKRKVNGKPNATTYCSNEDHRISNLRDTENHSTSHQSLVLKSSFELPLKVRRKQGNARLNITNGQSQSLKRNISALIANDDSDEDDDVMPRPIIIKQEPIEVQSEEIHLSWHSSTVSTIATTTSHATERQSKLSAALNSSLRNARLSKNLSQFNESHSMASVLDCSSISSPTRYQTLDISITKRITPRRSPRIAAMKKTQETSLSCRKKLNTSWQSCDEEPFQGQSLCSGEKSFVCSSPKASQIIRTPSSTHSPRKIPTRPSELDLMIELIEKENAQKANTAKKSPRKSSKCCLPGGYAEMYQRAMAKTKADSKFLKHDKKIGLVDGIVLRVINVECSHGVHVAKVQRTQGRDRKIFAIVMPSDMMAQLKSDSKLEAFFDNCKPYAIKDVNGKTMQTYINPYKLMLL